MSAIHASMPAVERGDTLSVEQMERAIDQVIGGEVDTETLVRWLTALSRRMPTADELVGGMQAFMQRAVRVPCATAPERITDTCGTGGARKVFNAGTLAGLLTATPDSPVAKHGNRSRTGFGSAETLMALGLNVESTPAEQARSLQEAGFCFCMAPRHHVGAAHAAAARRSVQGPTIFNAIGPLCNPVGAGRQLIGVWHRSLMAPMAEALARRGCVRGLVVHSEDGLDEISASAATHFIRVECGAVSDHGVCMPESFDVRRRSTPVPAAASLAEAVATARDLLRGMDGSPQADMLVLNTAAALFVSGQCETWPDAAACARERMAAGHGLRVLEHVISLEKRP